LTRYGLGDRDAEFEQFAMDLEQDAVDPTQMQSTARRALLQDVELMPQYQDSGFQPRSRLEEVAQHTDQQEADL
jgi:hypothetical protein